ncbi:MAG: signal recognition particle-docking protein FtsY [Oscillospiraceae bacterium]|nr:signal recognition particle-docking protein FtsY [Oscillospiraceae bacterium]
MALFDFWKKKKANEPVEEKDEQKLDEALEEAEQALEEVIEEAEPEEAWEEISPTELPLDGTVFGPDEDEIAELTAEYEEDETEEAPEAEEAQAFEEPEEVPAQAPQVEKPKTGLFARLMQGLGKTRSAFTGQVDEVFKPSRKIDDDLYDELEEALIMADIGGSTSMDIVETLRLRVKEKRISYAEDARAELRAIISEILSSGDSELHIDTTPSVVLVIGVNGVGKTTTIGKLTNKLKNEGKTVVLAAADTFRAAAADQLEIWAERNGVQLVRLTEGADPAAVIFDGCNAARSRKADVLICDTAGRLHNKKNLMEELKKIYRVIERELPGARKEVLLVLDATTGQNAVNQAEEFNKVAELTGIVLTKLDGTAKGGIVIQIIQKLGVPVKFIGVGEGIDDLQVFDAESFASALFDENSNS